MFIQAISPKCTDGMLDLDMHKIHCYAVNYGAIWGKNKSITLKKKSVVQFAQFACDNCA